MWVLLISVLVIQPQSVTGMPNITDSNLGNNMVFPTVSLDAATAVSALALASFVEKSAIFTPTSKLSNQEMAEKDCSTPKKNPPTTSPLQKGLSNLILLPVMWRSVQLSSMLLSEPPSRLCQESVKE